MARIEDTIFEQGADRGLELSKLTSRAIQQANLPDLNAALAESQAKQRNILNERNYRASRGRFSGLRSVARRLGQATGVGDLLGAVSLEGNKFRLKTGTSDSKIFDSIGGLKEFIKKNPLLLGRLGVSSELYGDANTSNFRGFNLGELKGLAGAGVNTNAVVNRQILRQLTRLGGGGIRSGAQPKGLLRGISTNQSVLNLDPKETGVRGQETKGVDFFGNKKGSDI